MSVYNKVKPDLIYFLKSLENYNEIPFNKKINAYGVSVGFVYKEMCEDFNLRIITKIEKCLELNEENIKEGKTFSGWYNMAIGKGFRDDVRSFSEEFDERFMFSREMIREEIYRIMKKMEKLGLQVDALPKTKIKNLKVQHTKYGFLNVEEWFELGQNNLELFKDLKEDLDAEMSKN